MKYSTIVIGAALIVLLTLVVGCALFDRCYVYFPTRWEAGDWAKQSGLPLEEVWFQASDGVKLYGWLVRSSDSPTTLLICHGNAGNIIHRLEYLEELHRRSMSAFIFDYRGYGRSEGTPSETGLYRDALAAYDVLTHRYRVPPERLVILGTSLGAAVAGELAATRKAAGLILETPFPSVPAMVRAHYGALPFHFLLRARYDLEARVTRIHIPVLVLQGDRDRVVPLSLGRAVYVAANPPKDFYLIRGADHNDTYVIGGEPYFQRIIQFIHEVT